MSAMNHIKLLFILISSFYSTIMWGQNDTLSSYWSFNDPSSEKHKELSISPLNLGGGGIHGGGVSLSSMSSYLEIPNNFNSSKPFSIAFWFKPKNVNIVQSLLYQTNTSPSREFIEFGINDEQVYIRDEEKTQGLPKSIIKLKEQEWYFLVYAYDGREVKLYLQAQEIYSSDEIALYASNDQPIDRFFIGRGSRSNAAFFNGIVDEIMVYNQTLSSQTVVELYEKYASSLNNDPFTLSDSEFLSTKTSNTKRVIPEKITHKYKPVFKGRVNYMQDSIVVSNPTIQLELWDYGEQDYDTVSMYLNNSLATAHENILLNSRRKKKNLTFNLTPNETNYLTFYATTMGECASENTATVKVLGNGGELERIYELIFDESANAVLRITHEDEQKPTITKNIVENLGNAFQENPKSMPKVVKAPEKKVARRIKTLAPIRVNSNDVILKISGYKGAENKQMTIQLNDSKPITEITEELAMLLKYEDRSVLNFEADCMETKFSRFLPAKLQPKCVTKIKILERGARNGEYKEVHNITLKLDNTNNIRLPIIHDPKELLAYTDKVVLVDTKYVTLEVRDNSIVDGDVISIINDGKTILSELELTRESKRVNVDLDLGKDNILTFIPVSMGTKANANTTEIKIWSGNKLIDAFKLIIQDKDKDKKTSTITLRKQ